jgi:hypothetical protein
MSLVQLAKEIPFLLRVSCYRAARSCLPVSLYPYSVTDIKVADANVPQLDPSADWHINYRIKI